MGFTVLIPARLASTRLPDKPLADIAGLPMVVRVAQRARQSEATEVVVATDDARIARILTDVKTIALVGWSPKPDRPSHRVAAFLKARGYRVIPVNPGQAGQQALGETVRASLADIAEPVDMIDIFRRSEEVPAVVAEALRRLPHDSLRWNCVSELLESDLGRTLGYADMEARMRDAESSAADLQHAVFGEAAIESYLLEGSGNLVQSPKSMLGFNLHPRAKETITGIAAHILEHIRLTASHEPLDVLRLESLKCF